MPIRVRLVVPLAILFASSLAIADDPQRPEARKWFEDARLGLFVHWGAYSLAGKGEWVMDRDKLPVEEYEKLAAAFNPSSFNPDEWARAAKAAGARYLTVTAKHHDGFCLFDSKLTKYDVVDFSRYGKDPLQALAEACRKNGIKLFFYYSLLDWHHPDYFPRGKTGKATGRPEAGEWSKYVLYYQGQIRELCTNYGEIGGIWLDGWWDRPDAAWDLAGTYKMIHDLQPNALVGNNHHVAPLPGEDFQVFEQDLPGENRAGFNTAVPSNLLPLETCLTINKSWGYTPGDRDYKTPEELIHALLGAAGRGSNLLVNVGPRPDGAFPPEAMERLRELGRWLEKNGQAVYETRRGPIAPNPWGVSVQKGQTTYIHVTHPGVPVVVPRRAEGSTFVTIDGAKLVASPLFDALRVELPETARTPVDTIILMRPLILDPKDAARPRR
jgi:alpha-L-fucosidase